MIALSPTTSPSPAGTKAADTDGSDAGLSAVFASLVAALLNPAGAAVGSPAPAAPSAAPAPSLGNTAIAAVANGPQMMSLARPAGPTASPAFVLPETAIDQPKGAAPGGPAQTTGPSESGATAPAPTAGRS